MNEAPHARPRGPPEFGARFRAELRELFIWRRDVRHFQSAPIPEELLSRLLEVACLAPSVGLSEPWRFVIVEDAGRRAAIRACFEACNKDALRAQGEDRASLYARLKLAGLDDAPCHIAVFADDGTQQGHRLGRHTMPETIAYSTVAAIHSLWLAARAEGIGLGWVSILEPARVAAILDVPAAWKLVGYLCLGYPAEEGDSPLLERLGWEQRRHSAGVVIRR